MDSREISTRLHDILRAACRVRAPGPGRSADAGIESIDQVKARLRALIADLGDEAPPHLPPRLQPSTADFPEGRIAGTRAVVEHRRRVRVASAAVGQPARKARPEPNPASAAGRSVPCRTLPSPRAIAEAAFRVVDREPMRA